uniref:Translation initiation factor IF-2-like n=1 Tax=Petromyzon marinus TaxID=7757 RepID=A0AAJ7SRV7_PETMA|nr:translation initiation factor IF-2-like [Petromyzon marinus]
MRGKITTTNHNNNHHSVQVVASECRGRLLAGTGSDARPFPPHACDRCAVDEADGSGPAEEAVGDSPCSSRSSLDASVLTPVAFAGTATAGARTPPMRKWSLPSLLGGVEMEDGRGGVGGRHTAWRRSLQVHPRADAPWHGAPRSSSSGGGLPRPSGRAAATATQAHARPRRRRHGAAAAPASSGDAETKRSQAAGRRARRGKDREGPGTPAAPAAPAAPMEGPARKGSLRESLRSFFSRGSRFPNATTTELRGERK